jgi:hypothetical protein
VIPKVGDCHASRPNCGIRKAVILSLFWRRISRDISDLIAADVALSQKCRFFWPKCRATANTFDAFREILRPKEGSG